MFAVVTFAQQTITGNVTDESGAPIPGATIVNDNKATTTDFDGNFTIDASINDVLTVSYVGYIQQEVTVTSTSIDIVLQSSTELDEVPG